MVVRRPGSALARRARGPRLGGGRLRQSDQLLRDRPEGAERAVARDRAAPAAAPRDPPRARRAERSGHARDSACSPRRCRGSTATPSTACSRRPARRWRYPSLRAIRPSRPDRGCAASGEAAGVRTGVTRRSAGGSARTPRWTTLQEGRRRLSRPAQAPSPGSGRPPPRHAEGVPPARRGRFSAARGRAAALLRGRMPGSGRRRRSPARRCAAWSWRADAGKGLKRLHFHGMNGASNACGNGIGDFRRCRCLGGAGLGGGRIARCRDRFGDLGEAGLRLTPGAGRPT